MLLSGLISGWVVSATLGGSARIVQIPKVNGLPAPHPYAISGDGRTVIGQFAPGNPFIWRGGEVSRFRPNTDAKILDHYAQAASFDGNTIVGKSGGAYLWKRGGQAVRLGKDSDAFAYGVNQDGSVVVGQVQTAKQLDGFVWSTTGGFQVVPNSPLLAVSPDGHAACGIRTERGIVKAFDWRDGLVDLLPIPAAATDSSAFGISRDGLQIVGSFTTETATSACVWENETYRALPNMGSTDATARCITYDGSYIGGYAGSTAVVWTGAGKGAKLADLLRSHGTTTAGWDFESVTGLARVNNNLYITGWAHYRGKEAGFWASISL
jgi:uncharacterized membrane protein